MMAKKTDVLSPQLKALKTTDLSPMIRMSNIFVPRLINGFLPKLDKKQRAAFEKVMPVGGEKKVFIHIVGSATPPIVTQMSKPIKMDVLSEEEVKKQGIKGMKLTFEDVQLAQAKKFGKLLWHLKGQAGTLLSMSGMFTPFLLLGPSELKDLKVKALTHFKPMLDLMPR
jgi:hypothetical protein